MNALDNAFDDAAAGDVFVADPSAWFPPPTDDVGFRLGWTAALGMVRRLGAPGLTDDEHSILDRLDEIAADIEALAADPDDPSPASWEPHLVAVQQAIMANAAARTHPTRYRLLGGGTA